MTDADEIPQLPPYYAITAPLEADGSDAPILEQAACREWLERFKRLLSSDIELIQLRARALSRKDLIDLAAHCKVLATKHRSRPVSTASGIRLLINGPPEIVLALGVAGVHLTSAALEKLDQRPLPRGFLVGASCHSPEELAHAQAIDADFACLSPVTATKGYAETETLGLERFAEWVEACEIPVYGLGGLLREDLQAVRAAGGQGVAGISAFWN